MWDNESYEKLKKLCFDLRVEFILEKENHLLFICAQKLNKSTQKNITKLLPSEMNTDFVVGPKNSTRSSIGIIFMQAGIFITAFKIEENFLKIRATSGIALVEDNNPIWESLNKILKNDGYFDGWEIEINNKKRSFNFKISDEVSNNEKRNFSITEDEITNLKILLGTTESVDDFLKKLG